MSVRMITYMGSLSIDIPDFNLRFFYGVPVPIIDNSVADKLLTMNGFSEQKNKKQGVEQ